MDVMNTVKRAAPIGALAGVVSTLVFYVLGMLKIEAITIPFSTITIGRDPAGLSLAEKVFAPLGIGFSTDALVGSLIAAAVAGAIFLTLGALLYPVIANALNFTAGKAWHKLAAMLVIASVAASYIVSMSIAIPAFSMMIPLVISSMASAYILVEVAGMRVP